MKKTFTVMDVAFANVFKISCRAGEKNGIWVKYFGGRTHFQDTILLFQIELEILS